MSRLLIVSQYFWPEHFRINEIATEMTKRGWSVTVLTGLPNYPSGNIDAAFRAAPEAYAAMGDVEVVRVPLYPRGQSKIGLMLNYLSFVVAGCVLGPWKLRGRSFDAIFMFDTSPILAALPAIILRRAKRAPLTMWVLDLWPETLSAIGVVRSERLLTLVGIVVRFIYRRCDQILVQSRGFFENVVRYSGGKREPVYFPAWPETSAQCHQAAPELAPFADSFRVIFTGNIGEAQDFPAVLEAARLSSPKIHWIIVGAGRAEAETRKAIIDRGLTDQVTILGRYPIGRMSEFYAGADALLVSLKADPVFALTIPGKVQTYLAAGRPILAMLDGEGARVIREAACGETVQSGDAVALAAAADRLLATSADARIAMGNRARDYANAEFNRDVLMGRLSSLLASSALDGQAATA